MVNKLQAVEFSKHHKHLWGRFVMYVDVTSNLKNIQKINGNDPNESYIDKYQDHIVCSYEYKLACVDSRWKYNWQFY